LVAARDGDVAKVRQLLAEGADPNARDDKGRTPLQVAAEKDAPDVVEALLQAGGIPVLTDWRGVSPLSVAESKKHDRVAALLQKAIGKQGDAAPACELGRLRSDDAKGAQRRFLGGHPLRVREAVLDALHAMGFVPKEKSVPANLAELKHLEVRRMNPDLAGTGGGAGGERAVVDFADTSENGRTGVAVSMDTKKGLVGRLRQHNWSVPVLDEAECLLALLGSQPLDPGAPAARAASGGATVPLTDGVPVKLRLFRFVNSGQVKEGTKLPFIVIEDIAKDGVVLVRRGSPGWGSITGLDKATSYGREARLRFQVDGVRAADSQEIRLRNSDQAAGRRSASRTAIAAANLPILGLWLKGNEKGIRAGIVVVGYVDGERQVRVVTP
jgi:Ankyrin repeats (3 copies)